MFITVATAAEIGRGIVERTYFSSVSISNLHSEVCVCVVLIRVNTKYKKMWPILILVYPLIYPIYSANIACQDIRYKYASTGSDVYNVPITPQSGKAQIRAFCNSPNECPSLCRHTRLGNSLGNIFFLLCKPPHGRPLY